jgi:hypothetical protein
MPPSHNRFPIRFFCQMVKRPHEKNSIKSLLCHCAKIARIGHDESHLRLWPFGGKAHSAFLDERRRQVNSSERITPFGQFQRMSSCCGPNSQDGALRG